MLLTNYDIPDILNSYKTPLIFIGMKNRLPAVVKDGNYIINLESEPSVGSHWLALVIRQNQAFYCDSFGGPPPLEVVAFVKTRKGAHLAYSDVIQQHIKSSNCGYYSCAFLIFMERNSKKYCSLYNTGLKYLSNYHDDSRENDDILKHLFASFSSDCPPLIKRLNNERIRYD